MKRIFRLAIALAVIPGLTGCGVFGGGDKKTTPTIGQRKPILGVKSDDEVDPALAEVAVTLPPATANTEWSQSGGSAAKAVGHVALGAGLTRAWSASIAGGSSRARLAAPPVVADGKLYIIDVTGKVHAMDAASGARLWSRQVEMDKDSRPSAFGGGVAYDQGRIYAANGAGRIEAIDATNGALLWGVKPAGPLRGAPTIANGNVYAMTQDNQIYAIAAADGAPQWNETASVGVAGIFGVASPAAAQGTIVAGFSTGELTAYRYENGRNLWSDALSRTSISTSVSTLTDIDADPVIDRGRVYAVGQGGRMASYDLVTGQRIWEINIAGIATPAIAGEWVFVLTDEAKLLCISRATGKIRWIAPLQRFENPKKRKGPINWTGPVLAGDRLIVANTKGEVWQVAPADGSATQLFELGDAISQPPVVANATLYMLEDNGRITAFR